MSSSVDNHYDVLGIPRDASQKEIKSAYVALARSLHPDKQKFGAHLMKRVNEAYAALSDPNSRCTYDKDMPPPSSDTATPNPNAKKRQRQSEHTTSRQDEFVLAAKCVYCNHIVSGTVMEAQCCGCLCCEDCRPIYMPTKYSRVPCQNKSCKAENVKHVVWNRCKFITDYLEKHAPTHECGKRVLPQSLRVHTLVCPHLNTKCFRCSGQGNITTVAGTVVECIGCEGKKVLPGKDWIKCFKCKGRGAYDTIAKTTLGCTTCFNKGALNGRWTRCFKCQGVGAFDSRLGRVCCHACDSAGAFRGFNIVECSSCRGKGGRRCALCKGKGSVPCKCGSSCKGHSNQFTRRYV